jgi:hypothetical protein
MKTLGSIPPGLAYAVLLCNPLQMRHTLAGGCPAPSFAAARTFDVSAEGRPWSVATGDFNGDGKPDLAVANYGCPLCQPPVNGSVSVLLGNGDGTFQLWVNVFAGPNPQSVVAGDFNGDGKADLAVANNGSTNIAVLLGNGDATFQTPVSYGVGGAPAFLAPGVFAPGDLNGDGKLDLAVANSGGVSVLLGNGDGTFQAAASYGPGASSVAVGDFNGDSKPDLAVTSGGGVSVLLGNGNGTFQTAVNYGVGGTTSSLTVGDFNGDGKADLAVATSLSPPSSDNVSVLLGIGDGTFQPAVHYVVGSHPYAVAAGDFNGDGKLDVAAATDVGIAFLPANGDGTFRTAINYGAGSHPNAVAAGDFDGDGKPDLAVADAGSSTVCVLLGKSDGTFMAAPNFEAGWVPASVAASDLNGDGKTDLAVINFSSPTGGLGGSVSLLFGSGDGTFIMAPTSYSLGLLPKPSVVGDFNGDGKPDLAVGDVLSTNVFVLLVNGDGTFQPAVNYAVSTPPVSLAVGDLNGDGKADLAVANSGAFLGSFTNGSTSVLLGNGNGTFQAALNYDVGTNPVSVVLGDFNGDGKLDLAVGNGTVNPIDNHAHGRVSVFLGNGDGTLQTAVDYIAGIGLSSVAVGDFNGDGKPDLAVANTGSFTNTTYTGDGSVSVLLGNGDGTFQTAINSGTRMTPVSVVLSDFNGDGKLDVAVVSPNGNVSVLSGNGDGSLQPAISYAAGSTPSFVAVADFNGDGKPDLAVANSFSEGTVSVLLNTCVSTDVELAVLRTDNTVIISWPSPSTGFVLESTPSLTLPNWQAVPETISTNSGRLEVITSFEPQERYFRLHKP